MKILQIGDIHLDSENNTAFKRLDSLVRCVVSRVGDYKGPVILLLTGDYTQKASTAEFLVAEKFLKSLIAGLIEELAAKVHILMVPGNHDTELGGDQTLREKLAASLTIKEIEEDSIKQEMLSTQKNFRDFASGFELASGVDWTKSPFQNTFRLETPGKKVFFRMYNTAWMSTRRERTNSLLYPLGSERPAAGEASDYIVSVLHHPLNWFRQPDMMRPMRDDVEASSDLIITAHEHGQANFTKGNNAGLAAVEYLEGGVLQERSDSTVSTFNLLHFDFSGSQFKVDRFVYGNGVYSADLEKPFRELPLNRQKQTHSLAPTTKYQDFLRETELPVAKGVDSLLTHGEIFTYPDLRERNDQDKSGKLKRIKADDVSECLRNADGSMLASDAMGGKTSLLKQLCIDSMADGKPAVFLRCKEAPSLQNEDQCRRWIAKIAKEQFGNGAFEHIEQSSGSALLAIDDLHVLAKNDYSVEGLLRVGQAVFESLCATVDTDFMMEESRLPRRTFQAVGRLRKFHIFEFGSVRLEELALRWLSVQRPEEANRDGVRKICGTVERVLRINAMPQYPWVLRTYPRTPILL